MSCKLTKRNGERKMLEKSKIEYIGLLTYKCNGYVLTIEFGESPEKAFAEFFKNK
jgi:hypothetical protein